MVGENGHFPHAEAALSKLQVGLLKRIAWGGMLEVEVAAQEEVSVGITWGRGGKSP